MIAYIKSKVNSKQKNSISAVSGSKSYEFYDSKIFFSQKQNRQLLFSPKIQYKLTAESANSADKLREAISSCLQFPVWWCLLEKVRTHFEQNPD